MFGFIQTVLIILVIISVVALIKPSLFHRFYKKLSRKHAGITFIALVILFNTPVGSWIINGVEKEQDKQEIVDQQKASEKVEKKAEEARELARKQEEQKKTDKDALKARLIAAQDEVPKLKEEGENWRKTGLPGIDAELVLLTSWAINVEDARKLNDPEMTELADRFAKLVSQAQIREFPLLRKTYVEHLGKKGWEFDLEASSYGTGNKTIELVNGAFAANKNIAQVHLAIGDKLKILRFARVNYKWYSGASEYQYFTIDSLKDSDVSVPKSE